MVGNLELKNATDKDIELIIDYLELNGNDCQKVSLKENNGITLIDFQSVNWLSHVDEDKINEMLKKLRKKLKFHAITLYFLDGNFAQNWYSD